jgi:hypothetical protein
MKKTVIVALALSVVSGVAFAQANTYSTQATGAGAFAPGSPLTVNNTNYTDTNGDGALTPDELPPDSQLAKRFATRDANKDGRLTRDEYFFK